jgi:hypothetical protein
VAAGVERGLHDLGTVRDERADHVADHRGTAEQLGQRTDRVVHLDHLVVDRLDTGDLVEDLLDAGLVAPGRHERDVQLAQVLTDQAAGVAGGAVDDDGLGCHVTFPFRRRPADPRR